jgi:hypothetical protein
MTTVRGFSYELDEKAIASMEASAEKSQSVTRQGVLGTFEVNLPNPPVWGRIWATVHETGEAPSNIIRADKPWGVEVEWCVYGKLVPFICGSWCIRLHCESIGEGPEFDLPGKGQRCAKLMPVDPCLNCYKTYIEVPAGIIKTQHCGTPYKLVVTVQYLTACKERTGPMTGFVEFPTIEFYEAEEG